MKFQEFEELYQDCQNALAETCSQFAWEDAELYAQWLGQTYEYARFSTRILALTAGHLSIEQTAISNRFIQHAAEEKGHDRLILNDLRALNRSVENIPLHAEAEAFHKSLYFWIYQGNPIGIMGWVLALEGFAVRNGPQIFERVLKAHGPKAVSFVKVHSAEDEDHLAKAFATVRDFTESDLATLAQAFSLYTRLYQSIYSAITNSQKSTLRAA